MGRLLAAIVPLLFVPHALGQEGWRQLNTRLAPLTLLPQEEPEAPACLDGSPYGFYFRQSSSGSKKWTISLDGGGWCASVPECEARTQTILGSSVRWPRFQGCLCMNAMEDGRMDDCNCLHLAYCDGASFSGHQALPVQVPGMPGRNLYFRGKKNLDRALDFAFAHGLGFATEFVLSGVSAGGLASFVHTDRIADRIRQSAPYCKVVAAPFVGFFIDEPQWPQQNSRLWREMSHEIFLLHGLGFLPGGVLSPACQAAYPGQPHYCFMPSHMIQFVRTPYFMFSSKYDQWQLENFVKVDWSQPQSRDAVLQFGREFLHQLLPSQADPKNGAVISSCLCHMCLWDGISLRGKPAFLHYAEWYHGKTSGAAATIIDQSMPNGNGTFRSIPCGWFPNATAGAEGEFSLYA